MNCTAKPVALLSLVCLLFAACHATPKTEAHGIESVAYLQLVSSNAYNATAEETSARTVTVVIDDTEPFAAQVNDKGQRTVSNAYSYKIATGAHNIEVRSGDKIILRKKIFASANEVKVVEIQ